MHPFQDCECRKAWCTSIVEKQLGSRSNSSWSLNFFMLFLSMSQAYCPVQWMRESLCWDISLCAWDRGARARGWGMGMWSLEGCPARLPVHAKVLQGEFSWQETNFITKFISAWEDKKVLRKQDHDHSSCFTYKQLEQDTWSSPPPSRCLYLGVTVAKFCVSHRTQWDPALSTRRGNLDPLSDVMWEHWRGRIIGAKEEDRSAVASNSNERIRSSYGSSSQPFLIRRAGALLWSLKIHRGTRVKLQALSNLPYFNRNSWAKKSRKKTPYFLWNWNRASNGICQSL